MFASLGSSAARAGTSRMGIVTASGSAQMLRSHGSRTSSTTSLSDFFSSRSFSSRTLSCRIIGIFKESLIYEFWPQSTQRSQRVILKNFHVFSLGINKGALKSQVQHFWEIMLHG